MISLFFLSDLYSNDKCTEKLKFIFISFVLWVDRGACHHIRGGETGGALEEADSQMFLWKSQAQDMGQLKFTMHFGPQADRSIKKSVLPGHVWVLLKFTNVSSYVDT